MDKDFLIKEFKDTLKVNYTKNSIIYKENHIFNKTSFNIRIVWSDNTVQTILNMPKNKHIAALNFADPYKPGGLVWQGAMTQEECLCRSSCLYRALTNSKNIENFYKYNSKLNHSTDRIIYSQKVLFFKDSNCKKTINIRWCDIITCAAPFIEEDLQIEKIKNRMKRIIQSAFENNVDILILGRWGCGAFGNDWNIFQKLWKEVIQELNIIDD